MATNIVVAGSSAGGIAAPFHAGAVAEFYPAGKIYVLSDSTGSYGLPPTESLAMWGALDHYAAMHWSQLTRRN